MMGMSMLINLLINPGFSLLPILVKDHFGGGALELAWLQSALGVGTILGGILLGVWGGFERRIITAFLAVIIAGIGITVFGLTPASFFLLALAALFVFALMNSIANGTFFATLQAVVRPEIQGRVFTLVMSLVAGMTPLGLALAGPVADILGERIWFIVGGIAFTLVGISAFFIPDVIRIEQGATEVSTSSPTEIDRPS